MTKVEALEEKIRGLEAQLAAAAAPEQRQNLEKELERQRWLLEKEREYE